MNQTETAGTLPVNQPQLSADPATNRLQFTGFQYDASGNFLNNTLGHVWAYDAESRLITQTDGGTVTASYAYDKSGLRRAKTVGSATTIYIYSGMKVIAEYASGAAVTQPSKEYIYALGKLLATLDSAGNPTYHHPDHLSNRLETSSTGQTMRTFGQLPFGDVWYETGTADKWKFTTYERDAESDPLDYATFRYYTSRYGRFMSPDPVTGLPQNPQSLNRYAYVVNDPVRLTDETGLLPPIFVPGGGWWPDPFRFALDAMFAWSPLFAKPDRTPMAGPEEEKNGNCIPQSVLSLNPAANLAYLASRAGAWLTGGTVGVGVGGGAGFGLGPKGTIALGGSVSGSAVFKTDGLGNSAVVISITPPQFSVMGTNPNWGDAGAGANIGVQLTADSTLVPTELTISGSAPDVNGSFGPVGGDWTSDSVSLQLGLGIGARLGGSVGAAFSLSIPVCKQ